MNATRKSLALSLGAWIALTFGFSAAHGAPGAGTVEAGPTTCAGAVHQGFNPAFYTVVAIAGDWDLTVRGETMLAMPRLPLGGAVLLRDRAGASQRIDVPLGGTLVQAPGLILVSQSAVGIGGGAAGDVAEAARAAQATTYGSGFWQTFRTGGCAGAMKWSHGSNCWVIECLSQPTADCLITVTTTLGTHHHASSCSETKSIRLCGGILEVPF